MNDSVLTHQSRWGYHPCDYAFFRKLKQLHKWYYETLHDHAAWRRWARKEPQNRVIRAYLRDAQGRRCGVKSTRPRPEPTYCPAFVVDEEPTDRGVRELYRQARVPQPHPVPAFSEEAVKTMEALYAETAPHFGNP